MSDNPSDSSASQNIAKISLIDNSNAGEVRRVSILKSGARTPVKSNGDDQKPAGRDHKVSFSNNLCDIKEVDNWKQYNAEEGDGGKNCCAMF